VLAEVRRQLSPYRNPVGHAVVANTSRVRESVDLALSRLGRGLRGKSTGSLVADPNPVAAAQGRDQGRTTLSWTAARTDTVEVHVGAPDGPLFSRSGPAGSAATGEWVLDGTVFYLQDASDGHPHHRSNTLDILTVRVMGGRNDRATLEIPVGHVKFGDLARRTPISRDWGFDRGRPVTRYYIERFLAAHAGDIRGAVLEIGDAAYTRRFGGAAVTKSDVLNVRDGAPETTIVADLTDAPQIASDSFDCVICTHTLQLIYDVHAAVRTLHRILKPGGVLLATVPGVGPTCGSWADSTYWKFTPLSARRIAEGVFGSAHVTVAGHGNALIAVAFLHGLVVGDVSAADLEADERGYEIAITLRAAKPIDG
jgi:SAM-dependent methyltransferase